MADHQPHRLKVFRELDALTGSPEATDALLVRANAAASERVERVVIDEHHQGVVLAGWMLTFPEVLAAVLPGLLAEANTRAEDAEAKARRFANLLGNNAKALNDTLPREVLRQKAAAWDEGADFVARHPGMSAEYIRAANSYRTRED